MLADSPAATSSSIGAARGPEAKQRRRRRTNRGRRIASLCAFLGALALVLVYALRGGSYDLVVRQQHGLVIWWIVAVGVALGMLPRKRPPRAALILIGALAAYAAWVALSLTWTESSERTTAELARVLDYLGLVTLIACVLDRHTWRAAAAGLGAGAMLVCGLALASRLDPSAFPVDQAAQVFRADRLDYPFGYWNAVGAWGAMAAAIALAWSAHDASRLRRAIALALVPLACATTYLTYSRAGVGAVAVAATVVLVLSRNRLTMVVHLLGASAGTAIVVLAIRSSPQVARATGTRGAGTVLAGLLFAAALAALVAALTGATGLDSVRAPRLAARRVGLAAALCALVAAAGLGPHFASKAWHSFKNTGTTPTSDPTQRLTNLSGTRYNLWKVALDGFSAHPVGGTGAGTYGFYWARNARDGEFVRNAHSLWLENMEELGAPGLLLMIGVAGAALWLGLGARRRSRRPASAGAAAAMLAAMTVYLLSASVDWMWQSTAVTVLALAAIATAGARLAAGRMTMRWPYRIPLVVVALAAGAFQLPGMIAAIELRHSQAADRAGNVAQALSWARDAISAEPWAASGYEQRALLYEQDGNLSAAASDLRRAISHEPTNFTHWLLLARVETELGHFGPAVQDLNRAHQLDRQGAVFQLSTTFGRF